MTQVQEDLRKLLVVTQAPGAVLEGLRVDLLYKAELCLCEYQLSLHWVVVHVEYLLHLFWRVAFQHFGHDGHPIRLDFLFEGVTQICRAVRAVNTRWFVSALELVLA